MQINKSRSVAPTNQDQLRADFDQIARLAATHDGDRYDDFLASLIPARAHSILDIGCGLGRFSKRLAGPHRCVTGVDLSSEMIARAKSMGSDTSRLRFRCADFLSLDFEPQSFDSVISVAALHHMPLKHAISRMIELLKPDGTLIIHDLRADDGSGDRVVSAIAGGMNCFRRWMKTGHLFPERALREAWLRHGANETYLTMQQVHKLASSFTPAARAYKHWFWRYTIVWQKG